MHATRKLWTWLGLICVLSFAVLGWVGTEIYVTAPPIPKQVVSTQGDVLYSSSQMVHLWVSLVPSGIYQAWASVTKGMWFARSPEVIHSPFMEAMVWMRVPGDLVFTAGALLLALFALRLWQGGRRTSAAALPAAFPAKARALFV